MMDLWRHDPIINAGASVIILKIILATIYWGAHLCQVIYICCLFKSYHHILCSVVLFPNNQKKKKKGLTKITQLENESHYLNLGVPATTVHKHGFCLLKAMSGSFLLIYYGGNMWLWSHVCCKWEGAKGLIFVFGKIL
jgi:hypothetical protein